MPIRFRLLSYNILIIIILRFIDSIERRSYYRDRFMVREELIVQDIVETLSTLV